LIIVNLFARSNRFRVKNPKFKHVKLKKSYLLLEEMAPLAYAEDFDNVGLTGWDRGSGFRTQQFCDAARNVIDEAIAKKL
jgi:putative NIF3 family GTP cyclohydrolase 1 type 2